MNTHKNWKWTGLVVMALTAVGVAGCNESVPGGPGSNQTPPTLGQADNTFELTLPVLASKVKQGEMTDVVVGISRGTNFDQDVSLQFTNLPTGVTVDPATPQIKRGDKEAKVTIHATNDAAIGDFKVNVTGHPAVGSDAVSELPLNVVE